MKTLFLSIALLSALTLSGLCADNIYLAPGSIDATTHSPAALKSVDDGTAQQLSVGETETQITPTLVVTASTYANGTIVGGKLTFPAVSRSTGGSVSLKSVLVIDNNSTVNKQPLQLLLFDTPALTGTYTDRAAFSLNAADASHIIRSVAVAAADYTQASAGLAVADNSLTGRVLQLSGTNALGGVLIVTSGTAAMTGTATMTLRLGVKQN